MARRRFRIPLERGASKNRGAEDGGGQWDRLGSVDMPNKGFSAFGGEPGIEGKEREGLDIRGI